MKISSLPLKIGKEATRDQKKAKVRKFEIGGVKVYHKYQELEPQRREICYRTMKFRRKTKQPSWYFHSKHLFVRVHNINHYIQQPASEAV